MTASADKRRADLRAFVTVVLHAWVTSSIVTANFLVFAEYDTDAEMVSPVETGSLMKMGRVGYISYQACETGDPDAHVVSTPVCSTVESPLPSIPTHGRRDRDPRDT